MTIVNDQTILESDPGIRLCIFGNCFFWHHWAKLDFHPPLGFVLKEMVSLLAALHLKACEKPDSEVENPESDNKQNKMHVNIGKAFLLLDR